MTRPQDESLGRSRGQLPLRSTLHHDFVSMQTGSQLTPFALLAQLVMHPRWRALLMFRFAQRLYPRRLTRPIAVYLTARVMRACAAELHPAARIGPGLLLMHTVGLVVGSDVVAGERLVLHQGVTLGDRRPGHGQPRLGDDVLVGAGAQILGPIHIGHGAVIAAGSVVLEDVPVGATVAGVPARVTRMPLPDVFDAADFKMYSSEQEET